jgi:hypothetical protein
MSKEAKFLRYILSNYDTIFAILGVVSDKFQT